MSNENSDKTATKCYSPGSGGNGGGGKNGSGNGAASPKTPASPAGDEVRRYKDVIFSASFAIATGNKRKKSKQARSKKQRETADDNLKAARRIVKGERIPDNMLMRPQVWVLLDLEHPQEMKRLIDRGLLTPYYLEGGGDISVRAKMQLFDVKEVAACIMAMKLSDVKGRRWELIKNLLDLLMPQASNSQADERFRLGVLAEFYGKYQCADREYQDGEYAEGQRYIQRLLTHSLEKSFRKK